MNTASQFITLQRICAGFAAALVMLLGSPGSTWASDLEIERASISRDGSTLRVRGKNETNDNTVTVLYPGDGTFIGTAQTDRDGDWNLSVPTPDPAPCRVRAEAGNDSDQRNVRSAPSDCNNNGGGGGGNNPPDANNDSYSIAQDTALNVSAPGVLGNDTDSDGDTVTAVPASGATGAGGSYSLSTNGAFTYTPAPGYTGNDSFTYTATDGTDTSAPATDNISVTPTGGGGDVTARGDVYATPVGTRLEISASRLSGVLYNDFGGNGPLSAELVSGVSNGNLSLNSDGSFTYTPNNSLSDNDNDSFTYQARDSQGNLSGVATVNIGILSSQKDFKIFMNYELGMHCTGFEFAYCCVLPPYNSILAQVIKPNTRDPDSNAHFPRLLEGDPRAGLDGLGRETVLRDYDHNGNFMKYYLEYYHDAQPRHEGQGKPQTSTLISDVEGNSLLYTNTLYDSAALDSNDALVTGAYNGATGVVLGNDCPDGITVNCTLTDATDNYANGWLNHFYIYADLEGTIPTGATSLESEKIRLGVSGHVEYPKNVGAALQPMGPVGNVSGFDNVLTFSADTGTVVYT
ncbi:MAG: cadherin-like domain-containing protein, partial [Gammaproteobacteria bacterium]